ncbi:unnamed protein product [Orchesella dallaii]|uniref:Uncharacterized protein n=1 Tax=Orchesella dallaii TaxID=48710 RepID=A0ABP1RP87_9HEXA
MPLERFNINPSETNHKPSDNLSSLVSTILAATLASTNFYRNLAQIKMTEMVSYMNGLFQTKQTKITAAVNRSSLAKINMMFAWIAFLCGPMYPAFEVAFHWQFPCKYSLAGYWIIPECLISQPTFYWANMFVKVIVLVLNCIVWEFGVTMALFVISIIQTLCSLRLRELLGQYSKSLDNIGGNMRIAKDYRKFQVFAILSNQILQHAILMFLTIPTLVLSMCVTAIYLDAWKLFGNGTISQNPFPFLYSGKQSFKMGAVPPNRINEEIFSEFSSIPMEKLPKGIFERLQEQDEEPPLDLINVLQGELDPNNVQLTPDCNTEVPGSARTPSTPIMPPPLPPKKPR